VKLLDRLVLRRFVGAYAGLAIVVLVVFIFADIFTHLDRFTRGDASFVEAAAVYYAATLPETFYLFAPFLSLIAAMWVVASLRRAHELVPLLAAGVRPLRVILPLFAATTALALLMWLDRELLIPSLADLRRTVSRFYTKEYRFASPVPDRTGGVLSGRYYHAGHRRLIEARYTRLDDAGKEVLTAAAWSADEVPGGWLLRDGVRVHAGTQDTVARIDSKTGWFLETDVRAIDVECAIEDLQYLSSRELRGQIERMRGVRSLEVQLARRVAYPVSSLVLLLLGLPFVVLREEGAFAFGVLLCTAICALFFVATGFFESMGARPGGIPPALAAWMANGVFGVAGVVAWVRGKV
jgi:lipopolysaccharide export system permease protein